MDHLWIQTETRQIQESKWHQPAVSTFLAVASHIVIQCMFSYPHPISSYCHPILSSSNIAIQHCHIVCQYASNMYTHTQHYGPEATPTKEKSTGRSESSSDTTMTSPVTKKNFKIGPLGDFEKSAFLYFHPSQYNLAPGIKGATDQILP